MNDIKGQEERHALPIDGVFPVVTSALADAPPAKAPVRDVTQTYFGVIVHDPYRYMENLKDPDVAARIKSQAHYTREIRVPQRETLNREIAKYGDSASARVTHVQVSGTFVFSANGVPNIPEFGSVKTGAGLKALLEMSPYAHVKEGVAYPAVLLTISFNDRFGARSWTDLGR